MGRRQVDAQPFEWRNTARPPANVWPPSTRRNLRFRFFHARKNVLCAYVVFKGIHGVKKGIVFSLQKLLPPLPPSLLKWCNIYWFKCKSACLNYLWPLEPPNLGFKGYNFRGIGKPPAGFSSMRIEKICANFGTSFGNFFFATYQFFYFMKT